MNFKETVYDMFRNNNRNDKLEFRAKMIRAASKFEKASQEAADEWICKSIECDTPDNKGKRTYYKKRLKALIVMDREQIQAANEFKASLEINRKTLELQLEATKVSTSVWFTGESNTPAFN